MNLEELKKYLKFKLEQLLKEKNRLQDEYKNVSKTRTLPSNQIELTELKNTYKSSVSGLKKMLPVSRAKLLEQYIKRETLKIEKKLTKVTYSIDEIRNAIKSIRDNKITTSIYPNKFITKIIIEYSIKNSIDPNLLIRTLIQIYNMNPKIENPNVIYNIEKALTNLFNEDGTIKETINIKTALFTINKLLEQVEIDSDKVNNELYISLLNKNLEANYYEKNNDLLKKQQKQRLIKQKQAIEKLKEYIEGTRIVKECNLYEFEKLLNDSYLSKTICDELISNMVAYIKHKKIKKYKKEIRKELIDYVSEENVIYIEKVIDNIKNQEGPTVDMINRAIEDIRSICRYLNMGLDYNELEESMYILETKICTLKALVLEHTSPKVNYCSDYLFVSDENNIPYALYSLGMIEYTQYSEVYKVFSKLNKAEEHNLYQVVDNIPIYKINNTLIEILYTLKDNKIVIIKINKTCQEDINLSDTIIAELKDFLNKENTPEDVSLAGTQAKVLDIELNLDNSSSNGIVLKNRQNNNLK
ncbi:MAG: hypothetical protein ACI4WW_06355 [Candidatus Coprovivens sp.]